MRLCWLRVLLFVPLVILDAWFVSAQPLPADVVPDQYELRFALNFQDDTFAGSEQILVNIVKPTAKITLHAVGISFKQVTIASGSSSQPATATADEGHQTITLTVRRRLAAGPARIRIEYSAKLESALRGLYIGRANGRKYAATQFEATDARRAYPCFDQPDLKASFLVTAVVPVGDTAISNGRVLSDTPGPGGGEHTVRFATTRKMSTYLLALAVGDFDCLGAQSDNTPIRVCAIRGKQPLGRFALDAAQAFLRFFDGYFAVKYPFGKLDLVAIPDFLGGGMENTGAIFFGEHDLLVDEKSAPVESQKLVAMTVAHEMAHQWLGDLVTMKWWNDLWLKEGFATFFETRPIEAWKPEWHAELDQVTSAEEGMAADQTQSARAVRTDVTTPAEIDALYDPIVYQKAGAVLRMVEATIGPEAFRAGVNTFLKKFSYSNATAMDFWTTLAENSVRDVDRILPAFLDQPGVPVVTVTTRCVTDATSSLALAQERFYLDARHPQTASAVWTIPVSTRPVSPQPGVPALSTNHLLADREQSFDLAGCNSLLVANTEGAGYFRSAYAPEALSRLAKDVETQLTPAERLRLLNDQWALAQAGRLDAGAFLSLVAGYGNERRAQIVERIGQTLRMVDEALTTEATREAFHGWIRQLLAVLAKDLEQPSARDNEFARRETQAEVLMVLGIVGRDADVLARARSAVLDGHAADAASPDVELAQAFVDLAASTGDAAVFDRIVANIEHPTSPGVSERNVEALAYFTDPALAERALEYALSSHVEGRLAAHVLASALKNPEARRTAWPFVKSHWKDVVAKVGVSEAAEAVVDAAATFCDATLRAEVAAFLGEKGLGHEAEAGLQRIQACIDFRTAQRANFERWVAKTAHPQTAVRRP